MYLTPLVRINRAISCSLIIPNHVLEAIALSEIISVSSPIFNSKNLSRCIAHILTFIYSPNFAWYILKNYEKKDILYHQSEICLLLLFNIYLIITKF